jgi:hypothetical protein
MGGLGCSSLFCLLRRIIFIFQKAMNSPIMPAWIQDSTTILGGGTMAKSRREFLTHAGLGVAGTIIAVNSELRAEAQPATQEPTPGAPPAFGTGPAVGPKVSSVTFEEAEKLVQVQLSGAERAVAAESWRVNLAAVYERRSGPRKVSLDATVAPWSRYNSVLPG